MKVKMHERIKSMKILALIAAAGLFFSLVAVASADVSKDEKKLGSESVELDKMAGTPQGGTVVTERLEKEFGVTDSQITALRDKKLGYGEIAIVFSLAQKLGGITDANINTIMGYRTGTPAMGWGEIARKIGVKLGPVVSQVSAFESASHRDLSKLDEKAGHGPSGNERGGGMERPERMDRPTGGHGRY